MGVRGLDLDERKRKILKAIIRNYLETGEPVGSRTISKYTDLNLSSATIRNEMADLEELGYIIQPHTSAGRIPSDKGYRLYVDDMMQEKEREVIGREKEVEEMKEFLIEKVDKVELLLQQMAKLLAENTNYATMITSPQYNKNKVKFIQLSRVEVGKLLVVVVIDGNIVRNTILDVEEELSDETLLQLNMLCNTSLNGLSLNEINLGVIAKLKEQAGIHKGIVGSVLDAVAEAITADDDLEIYTSGATNIFRYPELSDQEKAKNLIGAFEEKELLTNLVQEYKDGNQGIQVYIGSETPVQMMKDCSVVTATYELEEGVKGTIGIIGPKRMDYDKVVTTLKTLTTQLDNIYKKT
ncbi:MAG: heat-inducible transcription repressor HrcA [Lachnospiraceae bacterium]|nr:heat-inducible transcription repressor HrcA [Lachnospiraceae bacterium]